MVAEDDKRELAAATEKVLQSKSRKKLVVAGPGAGKTFLFRKLLELAPGDADSRLVLTFINNLRNDLERSLGSLANTHTLHGYCQTLLHREATVRGRLSADFVCYPGLVSLIKEDWQWLKGSTPPKFVDLMRKLAMSPAQDAFYLERSDYYDAVDFDDSVYRTLLKLREQANLVPTYELILIDEFQDFNKLEASLIDAMATHSPIIIAGDDDQALYSQLRGASWEHIRNHYRGGDYEVFHLPFCMRCPSVVVEAFADLVNAAHRAGKLVGRITKPYRFFEPVKGADSRKYPTIALKETSVQSLKANYFGKLVEEAIRAIPQEDVDKANENFEPVALVIGSPPYLPQVKKHLIDVGLFTETKREKPDPEIEALKILAEDPRSNLGWRIILGCEDKAEECVRVAYDRGLPLADVVPDAERTATISRAQEWVATNAGPPEVAEGAEPALNVQLVSYEGSKGMSAQHVFLIGVHDGDLPRNATNIKDIEICRFLVGLTRTKKQCSMLLTQRFGEKRKKPSPFVSWIKSTRYTKTSVGAAYWK
jgi:superfamily I DNA/RNA helicase